MEQGTALDYWLIFYRGRYLVALITVVSALSATFLSFVMSPVYEAKVLFYFPQQFDEDSAPGKTGKGAAQTGVTGEILPTAGEDAAKPYIGILKGKRIAEMIHDEFPTKPIANLLLSDVDFEQTDQYMLSLYSRDHDAQLAADVANRYIEHLNEFLHETAQRNYGHKRERTEEQIRQTQKMLDEALGRQREFEEKNHVASLDDEIRNLTTLKTNFIDQYHSAEIAMKSNQEQLDSHAKRLNEEEDVIAANTESLTTPLIESLRNSLADLSSRISGSAVQLGEKNVDMQALRSQYDATAQRLQQEVRTLVNSQIKPHDTLYEQLRQEFVKLLIDKNTLEAQHQALSENIKRVNQRLDAYPALKAQSAVLKLRVDEFTNQLSQLVATLGDVEYQSGLTREYAVIVDRARPPANPSFPLWWLNAAVAMLAGFALGTTYVFFVDYARSGDRAVVRRLVADLASER